MGRRFLVGLVAVAMGCTVAPEDNFGGSGVAPGSAGPAQEDDGNDDDDDDGGNASSVSGSAGDGTSTGGDGGDDDGGSEGGSGGPGSTGDWVSGGDDESSGGDSVGTTGGGEPSGAYGPCADHDDCEEAMACLTIDEDSDQGFCSPGCGSGSPPNHALCLNPPAGVTAGKECILGGFLNTCVLNCSGGLSCPSGTSCQTTSDGYGPFCFAT